MKILLIEDDHLLGKATRKGLQTEGYTVDWIENGALAIGALETHTYDCLVLDLGLPGMEGYDVLQYARKNGHNMPVLIITAREEIAERVRHLDGGADDFIIKPFDLSELAARIRVSCRRSQGRAEDTVSHGKLTMYPSRKLVEYDGREIALTAKEYKVLMTLFNNNGQVLSRGQLEEAIYGWGEEVESNSLEVHIHHLRKKLAKPVIETVHGIGYRLGQVV